MLKSLRTSVVEKPVSKADSEADSKADPERIKLNVTMRKEIEDGTKSETRRSKHNMMSQDDFNRTRRRLVIPETATVTMRITCSPLSDTNSENVWQTAPTIESENVIKSEGKAKLEDYINSQANTKFETATNTEGNIKPVNKAADVFNLMVSKPEYAYMVKNPGAYEDERQWPEANDVCDLSDDLVAPLMPITFEDSVARAQKYLLENKGNLKKAVDHWYNDKGM